MEERLGTSKILQQKMQVNDMKSYVGIDGCPSGWIASYYTEDKADFELFSTIRDIHSFFGEAVYLIDIPIGLASHYNQRTIDAELRKFLRPVRHHSVFTPPCREALYKSTYREALSTQRMITGKGISIQSWNIAPKIREVDEFLRSDNSLPPLFRESHPEMCFYMLNGSHLKNSKHSKEGREERLDILSSHGIQLSLPRISELPKGVKKDDLLDSMILSLTAKLGSENGFKNITGESLVDSEQLPMQLVYFTYGD